MRNTRGSSIANWIIFIWVAEALTEVGQLQAIWSWVINERPISTAIIILVVVLLKFPILMGKRTLTKSEIRDIQLRW